MASELDAQKLVCVFNTRPDILEGIQKAADSPSRVQLFNEIASFVYEQIGDRTSGTSLKRRRVDIEPSQNGNTSNAIAANTIEDPTQENILLEIKDISVSIPQRKKFELCFTPKHLFARTPGTTAPFPGIVYAWKDIEYAFYLPVPEKTQVQHNYVLFPRNSSMSKSGTPAEEPLVFAVSASAPKPGSISGPNAAAASAVSDSYTTLFNWALNKCLQAAGNKVHIVAADAARFCSKVRQPHRPKEPAVHVKAFRGSKDGFLFFLENGILWGFKKPLLFIPLDKIAAISYTNVLQRTFNIAVEVFTGEIGENGDEETEEIEFAMLDQEDYGGINEDYIARHKLQDRSMADQRKAKRELAENAKGKKGADGEGQDANGYTDDDMTELERAQIEAEQQLQDDEDEDEEDYNPGSDGESEGSGITSDDDDEDGDAAEGDEMDEDDEDDVGEED
ncbi:Rtt106-domain-containing protein [Hypoxylon crocopeplum]|nr:Rtt106-domain-containing protein [Hypoxylon crocopeplum]